MGKYESGLVSVIMPTYKRSEMVTRAVDSVLGQTYHNLELLLVNDNEPNDDFTSNLKQRVACYESDTRFNLVMQEKHINGAAARNVGIRRANGEYIAFLDDDDWWEPNKLEEQIKEIEQLDASWGGVSCKFKLYNKKGEVIGKTKKYKDGYIYKDILNLVTDVTTCSLLLKHEALDIAGYFDENLYRHQDLQLLVNFTYKYKLKEVDKYLFCLDVSDAQNRPDIEKLVRYKEAFFASVKPVMDNLSVRERKCIHAMHKFELGYVCLKNGKMKQGIGYCVATLASPKATWLTLKRVINKLLQTMG